MTQNTALGQRLKHRRKEIGQTLKEVAEKTGLTASFLSQAERGKVNLSLNSLQSIASALGVSVLYLLSEDTPDRPMPQIAVKDNGSNLLEPYSPVVHARDRSKLILPTSGVAMEVLVPSLSRKMVSYKASMEPGKEHLAHRLRESTEEIIYVLSGKMRVFLTTGHYDLEADESMYYEGEKLQKLVCTSDEAVVYISIITPAVF